MYCSKQGQPQTRGFDVPVSRLGVTWTVGSRRAAPSRLRQCCCIVPLDLRFRHCSSGVITKLTGRSTDHLQAQAFSQDPSLIRHTDFVFPLGGFMRPTIEKDGSVVWKVLAGGPPSRDLTSSQAAAVRSSDPRGAASVGLSYPKRLVAPSFYRSKPGEDLGKLQVVGGPTRGEFEARSLVLLAVVATALKGFSITLIVILQCFGRRRLDGQKGNRNGFFSATSNHASLTWWLDPLECVRFWPDGSCHF